MLAIMDKFQGKASIPTVPTSYQAQQAELEALLRQSSLNQPLLNAQTYPIQQAPMQLQPGLDAQLQQAAQMQMFGAAPVAQDSVLAPLQYGVQMPAQQEVVPALPAQLQQGAQVPETTTFPDTTA